MTAQLYQCPLMNKQVTITTFPPPIKIEPSRGVRIPFNAPPDSMECSYLKHCDIAQLDPNGVVISASWELCPAAQTINEKGSL